MAKKKDVDGQTGDQIEDQTGADVETETGAQTLPMVISSRADHFYRCGRKFTREPVAYPPGTFSPEEVAILRAEANLAALDAETVQVVAAALTAAADAGVPVSLGGAASGGEGHAPETQE
jgi:hypothetical protein